MLCSMSLASPASSLTSVTVATDVDAVTALSATVVTNDESVSTGCGCGKAAAAENTENIEGKGKVKVRKKRKRIYIAPLLKYLTLKALRYGSHSVTCKLYHTCLYLVSIHQMAHPRLRLRTSNCSLLLIYLPRKDERLSWPGWLVT